MPEAPVNENEGFSAYEGNIGPAPENPFVQSVP